MGYYAYGVLASGASVATTIALYLLFTGTHVCVVSLSERSLADDSLSRTRRSIQRRAILGGIIAICVGVVGYRTLYRSECGGSRMVSWNVVCIPVVDGLIIRFRVVTGVSSSLEPRFSVVVYGHLESERRT
jgi:hypothetical protein